MKIKDLLLQVASMLIAVGLLLTVVVPALALCSAIFYKVFTYLIK